MAATPAWFDALWYWLLVGSGCVVAVLFAIGVLLVAYGLCRLAWALVFDPESLEVSE